MADNPADPLNTMLIITGLYSGNLFIFSFFPQARIGKVGKHIFFYVNDEYEKNQIHEDF